MDLKLAACVIINRVYLSSDVGTICITEWAGQAHDRVLAPQRSSEWLTP